MIDEADHKAVQSLPDGRVVSCTNPMEVSAIWREIAGDSPYFAGVDGLDPDALIIDVGAHIGLASMFFSDHLPDARILAFEPGRRTFACLQENLARHVPNAEAFCLALAAVSESRQLTYHPFMPSMSTLYVDEADDRRNGEAFISNLDFGDSEEEFRRQWQLYYIEENLVVETTTLSAVVQRYDLDVVDLLKIDVERAELEVLNGVDEGFWSRIRRLVVEVHDIGGRLNQVVDWFRELGYRVDFSQAPLFVGGSVHTVVATRV